MNLNKMFVFIFVFFITFAVFLSTMPPEFLLLGVGADVQDKEAEEYFTAQDVLMYNYTLSFNLTSGGTETFGYGLPGDQLIAFEWINLGPPQNHMLWFSHLVANLWGWWYNQHDLLILEPYRSLVSSDHITKADLLILWNEDRNASYAEWGCSHISVKLFILPYNSSWTLSESWDNGYLKFMSSYEVDWSETGASMWHIMLQLLTFQNPDLGIPGIGGLILSAGVGGALWASVALLVFALITSVIPFVSGWGEG